MNSNSNILRFPWLNGAMETLSETPTFLREDVVLAIIRGYTAEVNRRAENRRSLTGKSVGPHLSAMREINEELGI